MHMPHATCHMHMHNAGWSGADCSFLQVAMPHAHATCHMPHATCHMPHATCPHTCSRLQVDCEPGYIARFTAAALVCVPCPPGTYEVSNSLCTEADSRHYAPRHALTQAELVPCAAHTAVHVIFVEPGSDPAVRKGTGAANASQCTCLPGYYEPAALRANRSADEAMRCTRCPPGAICHGDSLKPIARAGYGQLVTDGSDGGFFPCIGIGRCPGSECDCIGGGFAPAADSVGLPAIVPARCGAGYSANSPLCSICSADEDYAVTLGVCKKCDWGSNTYLLLSVLVIVLWFPITAKLTGAPRRAACAPRVRPRPLSGQTPGPPLASGRWPVTRVWPDVWPDAWPAPRVWPCSGDPPPSWQRPCTCTCTRSTMHMHMQRPSSLLAETMARA